MRQQEAAEVKIMNNMIRKVSDYDARCGLTLFTHNGTIFPHPPLRLQWMSRVASGPPVTMFHCHSHLLYFRQHVKSTSSCYIGVCMWVGSQRLRDCMARQPIPVSISHARTSRRYLNQRMTYRPLLPLLTKPHAHVVELKVLTYLGIILCLREVLEGVAWRRKFFKLRACSQNSIRVIKSNRMKWERHVACVEDIRNVWIWKL